MLTFIELTIIQFCNRVPASARLRLKQGLRQWARTTQRYLYDDLLHCLTGVVSPLATLNRAKMEKTHWATYKRVYTGDGKSLGKKKCEDVDQNQDM